MNDKLDYRVINFLLACVGGAVAVYVATAIPPPHAPGAPLLVPVEVSASPLTVYVTGAVQRPGLYQVAANARLYAALQAAGGCTGEARTEGLNLARRLKDEEMVVVPMRGVPATSTDATMDATMERGDDPPERPAGRSTRHRRRRGRRRARLEGSTLVPEDPDATIANAGSVEDLRSRPGMTTALAERLVEYRAAHGPLTCADDLRDIPGFKRRWRKLGAALGLAPRPDEGPCPPPGSLH